MMPMGQRQVIGIVDRYKGLAENRRDWRQWPQNSGSWARIRHAVNSGPAASAMGQTLPEDIGLEVCLIKKMQRYWSLMTLRIID